MEHELWLELNSIRQNQVFLAGQNEEILKQLKAILDLANAESEPQEKK